MYKVDVASKTLTKLTKARYVDLGLKERFDIQEWIEKEPSVFGEDLLIIAKEFELPSKVRLDLLAIDLNGNLVIVELKRDDSGSSVDWQAIKYASYCAAFSNEDIYRIYASYLKIDEDLAKDRIEQFITIELDELNKENSQRIILVSRDYHSDVVSAVLWLLEFGINIQCVRLEPYVDDEKNLYVSPTIIIPAPEARDYIKRREIKSKEKSLAREGSFSLEKSNLDDDMLRAEILNTFSRKTELTPRLICFFQLLLTEDRAFEREEVKQYFLNLGFGKDIGHAGRLLSNVSQFLTKKSNPHLRQVVEFYSSGESGNQKNSYCIFHEYRQLVSNVLADLEC